VPIKSGGCPQAKAEIFTALPLNILEKRINTNRGILIFLMDGKVQSITTIFIISYEVESIAKIITIAMDSTS
jgi:hypothetical protein